MPVPIISQLLAGPSLMLLIASVEGILSELLGKMVSNSYNYFC